MQEQQNGLKLALLEQFCNSVACVFSEDKEGQDEEPEAWAEEVGDRTLVFKKVEFIKNFGLVNLVYQDADNKEKTYRLSLELKRV